MLGIFLDTETNGLNHKKHRVIEIAYQIVDLDTFEVLEAFDSVISQPIEAWRESDPNSLKVNGFKFEDLRDGLTESQIAAHITNSFQKLKIKRGKAVYICQNPSFDRVFFSQLIDPDIQEKHAWPYHWLDLASMHWILTLKNEKGPRPWDIGLSKDKIAAHHKLPPEEAPHRAANGVKHLISCYRAL